MDNYIMGLQKSFLEAGRELETKKELIEFQAQFLRKILIQEGEAQADIEFHPEVKDFFANPRTVFADEDMNYVVLTAMGRNKGFTYRVEIFGNEDKESYQGYAFEPFLLRNKGKLWEYLVGDTWMDCQFDEEDDLDAYIDFGGNHGNGGDAYEDEQDEDAYEDDEDAYEDDEDENVYEAEEAEEAQYYDEDIDEDEDVEYDLNAFEMTVEDDLEELEKPGAGAGDKERESEESPQKRLSQILLKEKQ